MTPLGRLDVQTSWTHPDPPLVTILFAKHGGRTYPQAVAVAQQARVYREQVEGRAVHHVATFARTAAEASAASQLLQLTVNLKGSAVFDGDGVMVPSKWRAAQVLDCYRQAKLCADPEAYCHVVINSPFTHRGAFGMHDFVDRQADRWLLPCHRINPSYLAFDANHPASATSLIQAAAVRNGSHWCPNFDAAAFRAVLIEGQVSRKEWPMADDEMLEEIESDISDERVAAIESRSLLKREGWTIRAIRNAVHGGELHEPFTAAMVNTALEIAYAGTFLPKHRHGNSRGETVHFVRVSHRPASYRLLRP